MKKIDLNLRSDEINDILSRVPLWLVRWGTTIIFGFLISVICLFSVLKLPSKINGSIKIVENEPISNHIKFGSMEVDQKNIQSIKVGQPVILHLNSFPYLKYGAIKGVIYSIGDSVNNNGAFSLNIKIFKERNPSVFNCIKRNMSGTAGIVIGEKSIIKELILSGL